MARRHEFARIHRLASGIDDPAWRHAQTDLDACAPHVRDVVARMMDARPSALGAASYDGEKVTAGKGSSSTERLALSPDRIRGDIIALDRSLAVLAVAVGHPQHPGAPRAAARHAAALWRIVQAWKPHVASDRDRRAVASTNDAVPECVITRRTVNTFEPVHRTTTLGGLLPEPTPVSRWVYDFARRTGRLPTDHEMRRHHEGRLIRLPAGG